VTTPALACIGAGSWGRNLVRNFHMLGALRTVCEPEPGRSAAIAAEYPGVRVTNAVEEVLADPLVRAVAIATPAEMHAEMVARALQAGKDVFVEKPLCLSTTKGRELVALARSRDRILMVGHLLWYHPAVLKLKQLVDDGELGRIQYIYSNRLNLGKIRREENILWSFAPHDISVILGLVGEMPHHVTAQGGNYLHDRIADVTVSLLSFPSGVKAHVFVSWLHPFKEQKLVVVGDRSMAVFDDTQEHDKLVLYRHGISWKSHVPVVNRSAGEAIAFDRTEPLRAECAHFLESVEMRRQPRTDGDEGVRVLSVLERCHNALDSEWLTHADTASADLGIQPGREDRTPDRQPRAVHDSGVGASPATGGHPPFVHSSAFIDGDVQIGAGTSIWHVSHVLKNSTIGTDCRIGQNVVIGPNARVGNGVKIQNNVSVYEGVTLEDHVFCGPSMVFTNVMNPRSEIRRMNEMRPTLVRRGATIGANATVVCGVTIGEYAFVGAGAVVVKDVPDYALLVGNPARVIGWMCRCANRIRFEGNSNNTEAACQVCGQRYRKSGTNVTPM
jgi:UDP-2-acetamido-3-amino-2,3-dideoxy-glucuronate N-acetyltransferase